MAVAHRPWLLRIFLVFVAHRRRGRAFDVPEKKTRQDAVTRPARPHRARSWSERDVNNVRSRSVLLVGVLRTDSALTRLVASTGDLPLVTADLDLVLDVVDARDSLDALLGGALLTAIV